MTLALWLSSCFYILSLCIHLGDGFIKRYSITNGLNGVLRDREEEKGEGCTRRDGKRKGERKGGREENERERKRVRRSLKERERY